MTGFEIREVTLLAETIRAWALTDDKLRNWPVVYALNGPRQVYVGESLNVSMRFRQHLGSPQKISLTHGRVVIDSTFNKSACLDLESFLIRMFAGDGLFEVLNGNEGITNADYYDRHRYQQTFEEIFSRLRADGLFSRSIPEIENSDLFKLSPFKALSEDQLVAVLDIVEGLLVDLQAGASSVAVVRGGPGSGKTVVAIFLLKLLCDLRTYDPRNPRPDGSPFDEVFVEGNPELLQGRRIGFVIPQQSLRKTVQRVCKKTPGLRSVEVLTPFDVAEDPGRFDLLVVDEAHRLTRFGQQGSGVQNKRYRDVTNALFAEDVTKTQVDWILAKCDHALFLLDQQQSVRPADLSADQVGTLLAQAGAAGRVYQLMSQHRVRAGSEYVSYVQDVLRGVHRARVDFGGYDLRFFDDFTAMRREVTLREEEVGLARVLAGYAWTWVSRKDPSAYDMTIDGVGLQWNRTATDWVNSKTSASEVGSVHTIQGYDLNFAGVIIGPDLRYDRVSQKITVSRDSYHDRNGKANIPKLGVTITDDDLLRYVQNVYMVLLTRGILGTYVYVVDRDLREYLRPFFS